MGKVATITSKGQVVIPKDIRVIYKLQPQTKIVFEPMGTMIALKPIVNKNSQSSLEGKLAEFAVDGTIRSEWEQTLKKKLGRWGW